MTEKKTSVVDTITEGRFWITVVSAFLVTQGGAAVTVPGIAEVSADANNKAASAKTSNAVTKAVGAINDHADHIEALRTELAELRIAWDDARLALQKDMSEQSAVVDVLLDVVEEKHGGAYLGRLMDRIPPPPPAADEEVPPVARILDEDAKVKRLPPDYKDLQQEESLQ